VRQPLAQDKLNLCCFGLGLAKKIDIQKKDKNSLFISLFM
jgi:hypothetical protein